MTDCVEAMMARTSVPIGCSYLCLHVELDLRAVQQDHGAWHECDHNDVAGRVCSETGLVPGDRVRARAQRVASAALPDVQRQPFDEWYSQGASDGTDSAAGVAVWLDFFYSVEATSLCVRIVTDVGHVDGVTAVRVAMHMWEVLEGAVPGEAEASWRRGLSHLGSTEAFKSNPTPPHNPLRVLNVLWYILLAIWDLFVAPWRFLWTCLRCRAPYPNTTEGWLWHHARSKFGPGEMRLYASDSNRFKDFQRRVDRWRRDVGLRRGFFYLLNYSPGVCCGVVPGVDGLNSIDTKLANAWAEPGPIKTDALSMRFINIVHFRAMMFNNYGRHAYAFAATPWGFCWDWINMPGMMAVAFCISINGTFLCGIRGQGAALERGAAILEDGAEDLEAGGGFAGARRVAQITRHPAQRWNGRHDDVELAPGTETSKVSIGCVKNDEQHYEKNDEICSTGSGSVDESPFATSNDDSPV